MSKRGGNHPIPARASKRAPGRQAARKKRKEPSRVRTTVLPPSSSVLSAAHDREFSSMNERRTPKRAQRSDGEDEAEQPRYLSETLRGVARQVARMALAPLSLARAVVDRFRKHE